MLTAGQAQEACARIIDFARKAGAETADAVAIGSASDHVSVRLGKLEEVERSEGEDIGLRVLIGQRSASVSTSDFSDSAFRELAQRAVAMAKLAPEDKYAGLAPQEKLADGPFEDFDLCDETEPTAGSLRERALAMEDAALAVTGVTNSGGSSAACSQSVVALATSQGFAGGYRGTSHSLSASLIAGEGERMQRDYDYRTTRHLADLPPPASIGATAGRRAVARLDPRTVESGTMPILFDRRVSASLIGHLVGAMSGAAIARGSSFLLGKLDEAIFPAGITIRDNPHLARGLRSKNFDGEGVRTAPRDLVSDGRINGWLVNAATSRQLGLELTGHATRSVSGAPGIGTTNVHCEPGRVSRDDMIAEIEDGIWVNELIGQGVNSVTGDYSRGASGFRIRSGELAEPVSQFTIAGNLLRMFAALTPASDLKMHNAVNAPTMRVDGMTIAGE